jgi:hypothetical protein
LQVATFRLVTDEHSPACYCLALIRPQLAAQLVHVVECSIVAHIAIGKGGQGERLEGIQLIVRDVVHLSAEGKEASRQDEHIESQIFLVQEPRMELALLAAGSRAHDRGALQRAQIQREVVGVVPSLLTVDCAVAVKHARRDILSRGAREIVAGIIWRKVCVDAEIFFL